MRIITIFTILVSLIACQPEAPKWELDRTIALEGVSPIGMTYLDNHIWIADGDNNRLAHLDKQGKVIDFIEDFDRPMHLSNDGSHLFVPEYGKDQITIISPGKRDTLALEHELDAPAGVDLSGNEIAIADFYSHRILFKNSTGKWLSFGKEGKGDGELYYPTDVDIEADEIFIADAYNNRVQVFDKAGAFLRIIGTEEKMNATTGIYVHEQELFATDFEHDKLHVYNKSGSLIQSIEGLSKPTDALVISGELYISNYKNKSLSVYRKGS